MGVILVVFYKENEGLGIITGGVRERKTYSGALERSQTSGRDQGWILNRTYFGSQWCIRARRYLELLPKTVESSHFCH